MLKFLLLASAASYDSGKQDYPGPLTAKLSKAYGDIRNVQQEILAAQKEEDKEIDKLLPQSAKYKTDPSSFLEEPAAGQPADPDLDFSNLDSIQEDLQKMHAKMGGDLTSLQELKRSSEKLATEEDEEAAVAESRLHNMPSSFVELDAKGEPDEEGEGPPRKGLDEDLGVHWQGEKLPDGSTLNDIGHEGMPDDMLVSVQKLVETQNVLNVMAQQIVDRLKIPSEEGKLSMQDLVVLDMSQANTKALEAFKEVLHNASFDKDATHLASPEKLEKFKASMGEITSRLSENMHALHEHHRHAMREKQQNERNFQTIMTEHYGPLLDKFIEKVESVPKLKDDEEVGHGMQALRDLKDLHLQRSKLEQKAAFAYEIAPPHARHFVDGALENGLKALDLMFDDNAAELQKFKESVLPRLTDYVAEETKNGTAEGPASELAEYLHGGDETLGKLFAPFENATLFESLAEQAEAKRLAAGVPLEPWERGIRADGRLNGDSSEAEGDAEPPSATSFADLTHLTHLTTGQPSAAEEGYQKLEHQLAGLHTHLQGQVARLKAEARDEAKKQVEKLDSLMAPDAAAAPTGAFSSSNDGPAEALLEANATLAEGASATDQRKAGGHFRQAV